MTQSSKELWVEISFGFWDAKTSAEAGKCQNGGMTEAPRQTLIRRSDEPKLEIGDAVPMKDGVMGVVVARFTPSGENSGELHYIVELRRT